jgi:prepilin-type N-terminal cleavage/methylation domain-containing protein
MKKHQQQKGYTLIELMVSVTLFAIVMVVATGAIFTIVSLNRKAQSLKIVINNLNLAVESMTRDIRLGKNYRCDDGNGIFKDDDGVIVQDCSSGGARITFRPAGAKYPGDYVQYYIETDPLDTTVRMLKRAEVRCTSSGVDEDSVCGQPVVIDITDETVHLEDVRFIVIGTTLTTDSKPDLIQPRVLMGVRGYAGEGKESEQSHFSIQTTVSQKEHDVPFQ